MRERKVFLVQQYLIIEEEIMNPRQEGGYGKKLERGGRRGNDVNTVYSYMKF